MALMISWKLAVCQSPAWFGEVESQALQQREKWGASREQMEGQSTNLGAEGLLV
jgi:hypothetical protein